MHRARNFAFIHVPKCGGMSIRTQLRALDDNDDYFFGVKKHDAMGRVDMTHLPLSAICRHFPDVYAELRGMEVFAVTRDPFERFRSSVSMNLKHYAREAMTELDREALAEATTALMAQIERDYHRLRPEHAHFIRQIDMIRAGDGGGDGGGDGEGSNGGADAGDAVVAGRLYPICRLPAMLAEMGRILDRRLLTDAHDNRTVTLRSARLQGLVSRANAAARDMLPLSLYTRLKRLATPLLTTAPRSRDTGFFGSDEVTGFVRRFYGEDIDLHARVRAAHNQS